MCDTHLVHRIPVPAVHAKLSLVFLSFTTFSQRLKIALNFLFNNNISELLFQGA